MFKYEVIIDFNSCVTKIVTFPTDIEEIVDDAQYEVAITAIEDLAMSSITDAEIGYEAMSDTVEINKVDQ